jgi:hypothetical protein
MLFAMSFSTCVFKNAHQIMVKFRKYLGNNFKRYTFFISIHRSGWGSSIWGQSKPATEGDREVRHIWVKGTNINGFEFIQCPSVTAGPASWFTATLKR